MKTIESERKNLTLEEINLKYKGATVLRKYGSPKIFRIEEIDFKKNPKIIFHCERTGKNISYLDYYQTQYATKIEV